MKTKTKKYKLPKRIKAAWIKALRSGKYKQGEGRLKLTIDGKTTYCCLGVVAEILKCGNIESGLVLDNNEGKITHLERIPKEILGTYQNNEVVKRLIRMNDGKESHIVKKKTFRGIATWIEKNL